MNVTLCPNCNNDVAEGVDVCSYCGVSRQRYLAREEKRQQNQRERNTQGDQDGVASEPELIGHFRDILLYLCGFIGLIVIAGLLDGESLTETQSEGICKAAISHIMGRPTDIMTAKANGPLVDVSYYRDDGDFFRYQCIALDGDIRWQTNTFGQLGPLRGGAGDGRIIYKLVEDDIVYISETWADGSSKNKAYRIQ